MTSRDDCSTPGAGPGPEPQDPKPQDVAGHVVGCDPCGESLGSLQAQGNALKYLSTGGEGVEVAASTSVVERVLAESARAGRQKLADLLYELAKACLVIDANGDLRVRRLTEPRAASDVSADVRRIGSRSDSLVKPIDQMDLLESAPAATSALQSATSCLIILGNVEGESPRHQLALVQVLFLQEDFNGAEAICRSLIRNGLPSEFEAYALTNLTWVLNRQEKFEEAARVGARAVESSPNEFMAAFNYSTSLARIGDLDKFRRMASRVSAQLQRDDATWMRELVLHDSERFARYLSCTVEEVRGLFGVGVDSRGAN